MSLSQDELHPLDPLVVAVMRKHGEGLAPDEATRQRIWSAIRCGMAERAAKRSRFSVWKARLARPRYWGSALAFVLLLIVILPQGVDFSPEPDWNTIEFKGVQTVRLEKTRRDAFLAALRQSQVLFEEISHTGQAAVSLSPEAQEGLDDNFRRTWHLPEARKAPLIVVFE